MSQENVFIISRRAWEQDDLDYGSFEPIFVTLKDQLARRMFADLRKAALTSENNTNFKNHTTEHFEYQRKGWFYEYKLVGYTRDKLEVKFKKDDPGII